MTSEMKDLRYVREGDTEAARALAVDQICDLWCEGVGADRRTYSAPRKGTIKQRAEKIVIDLVAALSESARAEAAEARCARLEGELESIAHGTIKGASTLAINGDWKGMVELMQGIARAALSDTAHEGE
ncbi:MAG: hypothetical protein ACR2OV_00085 [Hyphomicrobiaceae bacterium]